MRGSDGVLELFHGLFGSGEVGFYFFETGGRYMDVGSKSTVATLGHLVEVSHELVKLFLRDGIKLVIMAAGAKEAHAHPHLCSGGDAVDDVLSTVFLWDNAALDGDGVVAVEAGGHLLLQRGVGQQIAGKLLDGELIKGKVAVVGIDYPIPPRPHVAVGVVLITVGVCVARGIEPIARHVFAVPWRGE